jgi:hypothetical protein
MFEEEDGLSTTREHGSKLVLLKAKSLLVVKIRAQPGRFRRGEGHGRDTRVQT